ncbi:11244_t:CDS:2 [Gigaspora margarita]|uniref:11244_t:CDS:1 n=1 Tax=Gigaspora margarita TaxID=4874 RepID=A0ABN7UUU5_GIGMA|nr:11244_t:CDS:2 [Gigaspora margarita]
MKNEIEIPLLKYNDSTIDIIEYQTWLKMLKKKTAHELKKKKEEKIRQNIKKRFGLVKENERKLLRNVLERPYNKITIDRVRVSSGSNIQNSELITEPERVREQVTKHFKKQFRRRQYGFGNLEEGEWYAEYKLKDWIENSWYSEILELITEKDCTRVQIPHEILYDISNIIDKRSRISNMKECLNIVKLETEGKVEEEAIRKAYLELEKRIVDSSLPQKFLQEYRKGNSKELQDKRKRLI